MGHLAISARGISKSYRITTSRNTPYRTLQEELVGLVRAPLAPRRTTEEFWALQDVSFDVAHGESVGIIGRNGAGKSTLLKILSRITRPTRGSADVYGRMGSLLEVGTGFHPELTGRENVFLNGAILGMSRSDIRRRFDEIVAFAEVEQFLDVPVKRYSSGMYMRLAFSVAAHLEPDILVVDEVLSVGDATFQAKSLGKMGDVARSGRTVLFVSHNLAAVSQLCQSAILLERGGVASIGPSERVVGEYLASGNTEGQVDLDRSRAVPSDAPVRYTFAEILDAEGRVCQDFSMGAALTLHLRLAFSGPPVQPKLAFSIIASDGLQMTHSVDTDAGFHLVPRGSGADVRIVLPDLRFYPGEYAVTLFVSDRGDTVVYDHADRCLQFRVVDGGKLTFRSLPRHSGLVFVSPRWSAE